MELSIKRVLFGFGEYIQTQIFDVYNINEVIIQTRICISFRYWTNKLFSEENKVLTEITQNIKWRKTFPRS